MEPIAGQQEAACCYKLGLLDQVCGGSTVDFSVAEVFAAEPAHREVLGLWLLDDRSVCASV